MSPLIVIRVHDLDQGAKTGSVILACGVIRAHNKNERLICNTPAAMLELLTSSAAW